MKTPDVLKNHSVNFGSKRSERLSPTQVITPTYGGVNKRAKQAQEIEATQKALLESIEAATNLAEKAEDPLHNATCINFT